MNSSIERIINNDRKAREAVAAAEQYRRKSAEAIAKEKAELERKASEGLATNSKNAMERFEKEAIRNAEEKRKKAEETAARMDALYSEKRSEWIDTYTKRIIGG